MWALFWVISHIANFINPGLRKTPNFIPSLSHHDFLALPFVGHDNNGEQLFSMDVQYLVDFPKKTTSKVAQHPWEIHQQHPVEVAKPYWPCPAPNSVPPNLEPALR